MLSGIFKRFHQRTRCIQEELAQKRDSNAAARAKLLVDSIIRAQDIEDPNIREATLEAIRDSATKRVLSPPPFKQG
jgi:hypothetical protein